MIHLRPYASSDEARLLPFLHDFNPHIGPESWRKLLGYQWENSEGFNGMLLENEGAIVGFLSYVISRNIHNGRELTHCNLSSWIVLPEYRSKSMQLLSKAFTINNVLVLNLTPHEHTRPMFRGLRFETLAEWEFRINPFRLAYAREAKEEKLDVTCTPVKAGTSEYNALSGEQKTMLRDHLPYTNVRFYRFGTGRENLVLAFNEKRMAPAGWKNRLKALCGTRNVLA